MFEVCLLKNTSGLGFSFSREENIPNEPPGSSMVRVKKLFPGQPAAESGRIKVGDVILRVNQTPLKGLSQHVCNTLCLSSHSRITSKLFDVIMCLKLWFLYILCRRWYPLWEELVKRWLCFSVDLSMAFFLRWTLQLWWVTYYFPHHWESFKH